MCQFIDNSYFHSACNSSEGKMVKMTMVLRKTIDANETRLSSEFDGLESVLLKKLHSFWTERKNKIWYKWQILGVFIIFKDFHSFKTLSFCNHVLPFTLEHIWGWLSHANPNLCFVAFTPTDVTSTLFAFLNLRGKTGQTSLLSQHLKNHCDVIINLISTGHF
jgi:hypothetical protein